MRTKIFSFVRVVRRPLYIPEEIIIALEGICIGLCAGSPGGSDYKSLP
ncbi:MAG: hypothetical protein ACK4GE_02845 [Caldimicrobium sp.]